MHTVNIIIHMSEFPIGGDVESSIGNDISDRFERRRTNRTCMNVCMYVYLNMHCMRTMTCQTYAVLCAYKQSLYNKFSDRSCENIGFLLSKQGNEVFCICRNSASIRASTRVLPVCPFMSTITD